jgi:hypothetical protein
MDFLTSVELRGTKYWRVVALMAVRPPGIAHLKSMAIMASQNLLNFLNGQC